MGIGDSPPLNVATALGQMGESAKIAIPHLISLLKDSDFSIHESTTHTLENLGYQPEQMRQLRQAERQAFSSKGSRLFQEGEGLVTEFCDQSFSPSDESALRSVFELASAQTM